MPAANMPPPRLEVSATPSAWLFGVAVLATRVIILVSVMVLMLRGAGTNLDGLEKQSNPCSTCQAGRSRKGD